MLTPCKNEFRVIITVTISRKYDKNLVAYFWTPLKIILWPYWLSTFCFIMFTRTPRNVPTKFELSTAFHSRVSNYLHLSLLWPRLWPSWPKNINANYIAEVVFHHRLNGSLSPVLTATLRSYGKGQISTPTKSKPLNGLEWNLAHLITSWKSAPKPNLVTIAWAEASG